MSTESQNPINVNQLKKPLSSTFEKTIDMIA